MGPLASPPPENDVPAQAVGRKKSFLRGAAVDFGGSLLMMVAGFAATPLILRNLSDSTYGFWMTVMQLIGLMGILEMGASLAVTQKASDPALAADRDRLGGLMSACLAIQLGTAALILLVGFGLSDQVFAWFNVDASAVPGSVWAFRSMVCWSALGLVTGLYPALLAARQRLELANTSAFVNQFLATLLPLPFLIAGYGVSSFPAAQWIAGLSGFALSAYWVSRKVPPFRFRIRYLKGGALRELLGFSFYNWIGKLSFLITNASDNILIGAFLGAPAVTPFLITSKLATLIAPNMARLASSSMPGFAELFARGDFARLGVSVLSLYRLSTRVACFGAALVFCLNGRFVSAWVGESRYAGATFTALLTLLCLRDTLTKGTGVIIIASGRMKGFGIVTLLEAAAKVGLAYLLMKHYSLGLTGLLLAQLLPTALLSTLYFPIRIMRLTGLRPGRLFFGGLAMPVAKSLPSLACLAGLSYAIPAGWGWWGIILIAGSAAIVNVCVFELPAFLSAAGQPFGGRLKAALRVNF